MMEFLKTLVKQPYWIVSLILGVGLISFPCITVDKDHRWSSHPPSSLIPVVAGSCLLLVSVGAFGKNLFSSPTTDVDGLDLTLVHESHGVLSTSVEGSEIRVAEGRIEEYPRESGTAIVLPCNEYFDDRCANDTKSALGAYVNRIFEGHAEEFVSLVKKEARKQLGAGTEQQKTTTEREESFGPGRCLMLLNPLGRPGPLALVSTTTQRAGKGLSTEISCLFQGMHELANCLADARVTEVAMPVLGSGHGGIHPPLAFMGLLLAVAEIARYGQGSQRPKKVTIIIFRKDVHTLAIVDRAFVRRSLALIASQK